MNKRPLMIALVAMSGFACEQQPGAPPDAASAPAAAPATGPVVAQADGLDARETRLVMLKLPAMV